MNYQFGRLARIVSLVLLATVLSPIASRAAIELACPPDLVLLTCSGSAPGTYRVSATGYDGEIVCVPPSGSMFPLGATTVTCTATNLAEESATCSFVVNVKDMPSRWACPPKQPGIGIPFELAGGATAAVRPGPGPGGAGISIYPSTDGSVSGIELQPGRAQAITFTTRLDAAAPVGSGFDLADPMQPNSPPILSIRSKGAKGYCVKTAKRFADEPGMAMRGTIINSNGAVLTPVEFTADEIDSTGILDISFQPGVSNCHITVEVSCVDGTVSIDIPGPITQAVGRKGWDGCIYGPDRPVKKPTSRLVAFPITIVPSVPPIVTLSLRTSGWPEMIIEEPSLTSQSRKWGDGHVTLMKAYDDEPGMEFVSLAPNGGVYVDLGPSTSFSMRYNEFADPAGLPSEHTFRIRGGNWPPGTTTNRPPPPFAVRLSQGAAGIDCAADYAAFGPVKIMMELRKGGSVVKQVTTATCTLDRSPIVIGCPGVGVLRLSDPKPFSVFWGDGTGDEGDELRIFPELTPGTVLAESFSIVECRASEGVQAALTGLEITTAPPQDHLSLACPSDIVVSATSSAGATVNYSPILHAGECAAFPFPTVVCSPPSGSVFPVGTTVVACSVTNACGESVTCSFNVTVDRRPVITMQPVSQIVSVGDPVQLAANAFSEAPAFYRWEIFCPPTRPDFPFCGCLPAQTWRPLCLGCPPPFVEFPSVTADCGAGYYLVVSNDFGMVTSAVANITVTPRITCPPDLYLVTCSNSIAANFRVDAVGAQGVVACDPPSGSEFPVGTNVVTCTATNFSGGVATCTFNVIVKPAPTRWACRQIGIGLPFEPLGGGMGVVRPDTGDGDPAILVVPQAGVAQSGVILAPGAAAAVTFTTVLDFTAPEGSGFDIMLPPDPAHPNDPPILSMRSKGAKGYCVKSGTKFADDPALSYRAFVVNTNGDLLAPIIFSNAEIQANGVFEIGFQPGVSNCHITVEIDCITGAITVEIPGPVTTSAARKGWDGCIYGPDRPVKKPTARIMMVPSSGSFTPPPITELLLAVSGWPDMPVENPNITMLGRKWGDGHVTLMKAYDDGEQGMEFRSFGPGGGVEVDLGHTESFDVRLKTYFETGDVPTQDQLVTRTFGPIRGLTNRPPPPFLDAMKLHGATGDVACSVDFSNFDSPTVSVWLYRNGMPVAQRLGIAANLDTVLFNLPDWPETLGKIGGATPCRRGTFKPGLVRLPGGAGFNFGLDGEESVEADEFRILAELAPDAPRPDYYSGFEFLTTEGRTWRVSELHRTLACTPGSIGVSSSPDGTILTWSGDGFRLQGAVGVAGPWFDLGQTSPVTLDAAHEARFFRLRCD